MKKMCVVIKILATLCLFFLTFFVCQRLEYVQQIASVDNVIGAMPVITIFAFCIMSIILVWKKHQTAVTSTTVFALLDVAALALFILSLNGNWFPLAKSVSPSGQGAPRPDKMAVETLPAPPAIGISDDFPLLDGATALYPLYQSFANAVYADSQISDYVACSNTANAYEAIISKRCDIIFVAGPSQKQMEKARQEGAHLVFTPIGKEAFVFMVGKDNPVDNLSHQQLKNIYSGKTAKWKTLGWENGGDIIAFQRPEGSGSQTGLQNIMDGLPIFKARPLPDSSLAGTGRLTEQISVRYHGVQPAIGYSYRYYATKMYPNEDAKLLSVDGVYPTKENIAAGAYAFSSEFYAVTNGEPQGNVKKLIEWILSEEGQYLVEKVGYVPLS